MARDLRGLDPYALVSFVLTQRRNKRHKGAKKFFASVCLYRFIRETVLRKLLDKINDHRAHREHREGDRLGLSAIGL